MLIGVLLLIYGFINEIISSINIGIATIIIGIITYILIPDNVVNISLLDNIINNNNTTLKKFIEYDHIKKIIFIPPYENLPYGGAFLSKTDKFNINLGAFDNEVVEINNRNLIGLLLAPTPYSKFTEDILNKTQLKNEYSDEYSGIEIVSSILNSKGLKNDVEIIYDENSNLSNNEDNKIIKINVSVKMKYFKEYRINNNLRFLVIGCPVCSTIVNTLAKLSNELILVENVEYTKNNNNDKNSVTITLKKIGTIDSYLW